MEDAIPKVKIGDRFPCKVQPENFVFDGEVVYISPNGRFYTMEFTMESGVKFRESYQMIDGHRCGLDKVTEGDIVRSIEGRISWGGFSGQRSNNSNLKLCS